jgi:hypothetical protein
LISIAAAVMSGIGAGVIAVQLLSVHGEQGQLGRPSVEDLALAVPGEVYDLAYDEERGLLWFALMQISDKDWLYSVSVLDATERRWELPDSTHNGYLSHVKIGDDGVVWVSQEYSLTRFDPDAEAVASVALDLEVDLALPDALDHTNPLPGTWISAITPYRDGVLVARNNVAGLSYFDSELIVRDVIPVPAVAGPRDLAVTPAGQILALGNQSELDRMAVVSESGMLIADLHGVSGIPESRVTVHQDVALVSGKPAAEVNLVNLTLSLPPAAGSELVAAHPDGGYVGYLAATGRLQHLRSSQLVETVDLPMFEGEVFAPPPGDRVPVRVTASVTDLVVDVNGRAWYFVLEERMLHGTAF